MTFKKTKQILTLTTILLVKSSGMEAPEIDPIDKIAIDHTLYAFNAYDKEKRKDQPTEDTRIIGITKKWNDFPASILQGWSFYKIMGETGCHQLSLVSESLLGVVGYNSDLNMLTIAYRGSQQNSDWANNLNPGRRILENANNEFYLHAGYAQAFEASKSSMLDAITVALSSVSSETREKTTVVCTGHSFGGATATIAAYYLADLKHFNHIQLRVFGATPVGTSTFNDWMMKNLEVAKTIIRNADVLPALLPSSYWCRLTGKQIILPPQLDDSVFNHAKAHDNRRYQQEIYEALGLGETYVKLFDIEFFINIEYKVTL